LANDVPSDGSDRDSTFAVEQEQKYALRYEEGFDLPDPQYDAWLRVHHPDHLRVTTQQDTGGGNNPTSHGNSVACSTQSADLSAANATQRSPLMDLLKCQFLKHLGLKQ